MAAPSFGFVATAYRQRGQPWALGVACLRDGSVTTGNSRAQTHCRGVLAADHISSKGLTPIHLEGKGAGARHGCLLLPSSTDACVGAGVSATQYFMTSLSRITVQSHDSQLLKPGRVDPADV